MEKQKALEIASKTIRETQPDHEWVILDENTVEKAFGWVFFYTTKKHYDTGDPKYIVPGNAPIVVNRFDGNTTFLSTSATPQIVIDEYEKKWCSENKKNP